MSEPRMEEEEAMYFVDGQPFGVRVIRGAVAYCAQCPKCQRWMTLPHTILFEPEGPTVKGLADPVICGYSDCKVLFTITKGIGKVYA